MSHCSVSTRVKSIYLHDNRNGQHHAGERRTNRILQAVISRASFQRTPRNGKSYFTMMSLRINNTHAPKKRGIAKNLLFAVRTVTTQQRDFNGAAWRHQSGSDSRSISNIEEAFVNTNLPLPPGPTPLWKPGGVPGEWSDVCGL